MAQPVQGPAVRPALEAAGHGRRYGRSSREYESTRIQTAYLQSSSSSSSSAPTSILQNPAAAGQS